MGLTSSGGANGNGTFYDAGTIIRYMGGDTFVNSHYNLPANAAPFGALTEANNGKMYGVTRTDGIYSGGTLFEYDYPIDSYKVLANFPDQSFAWGQMVQSATGTLYGITYEGGMYSGGTIYSYVIGDTTTSILYNFPSGTQTAMSLLLASNGKLYGMAWGTNGGYIYEYGIYSDSFDIKYNLPASAYPEGKLIETYPGIFYGFTRQDGTNGYGTIFRFDLGSLSYNVLYNFTAPGRPFASPMIANNGLLYGASAVPTSNTVFGNLFSFDTVSYTYSDIHTFMGSPDGGNAVGDLFQASDGVIYGMTNEGGLDCCTGTIFSYNIVTNGYSYLQLNDSTGYEPVYGGLIEYIPPVAVSTNPANQFSCTGDNVSFIAAAIDTPAARVQWQVSTDGGLTYTNITGATSDTLSFIASSSQNGNKYRAVYVAGPTSDTTAAAILSVKICAGINSLQNDHSMHLFPNPNNGSFTLEALNSINMDYMITDMIGNIISQQTMRSNRQIIYLPKASDGVYTLSVTGSQPIRFEIMR